jgi:hypothetical protein
LQEGAKDFLRGIKRGGGAAEKCGDKIFAIKKDLMGKGCALFFSQEATGQGEGRGGGKVSPGGAVIEENGLWRRNLKRGGGAAEVWPPWGCMNTPV